MEIRIITEYPRGWETWLESFQPTVAIDTETTDLRYYKLRLVGLSLCDGQKAAYLDLPSPDSKGWIEAMVALKRLFLERFRNLIFHNAAFDIRVLEKEFSNPNVNGGTGKILSPENHRLFDTMVAAHLINENRPVGLKALAETLLGANVTTYVQAASKGQHSKQFHQYAVNDAIWTWKLHKMFNKLLSYLRMDNLFYTIEMPFQWVLADLMADGVQFDLEYLTALRDQLESDRNSCLRELYDMAGKGYSVQPGLFGGEEVVSAHNLKSSQQLVKILEDRLGLQVNVLTQSGKKSAGNEALQKLKDQHPFVEKLLVFKIIEKALDGFVIPAFDFIDPDGRIRPSYKDCGTRTGRLSCSNPNLQQLPRLRAEYPFEFRKCFIAPKGKKLIALDYSSQEMRVLAHLTQDPTLLKVFRNNLDPHLMTAKMVYNLDIPEEALCVTHPDYETYKEKYKEQRHVGKNGLNFPIIYGTTATGIARRLEMSEEKAQALINRFMASYPKVQSSIKRCIGAIKKQGWVVTQAGRRRRLDPNFSKSFRQGFNFLIQGLCADILRAAMIHVHRYARTHPNTGLKIVMSVHDEVVVEVNEECAETVAAHLQKIMQDVSNLSVPLEVTYSIGNNYGEVK